MGRIEKNIKRIIQRVANGTFQICVVEQVDKKKSFNYSPLSEIIFQPLTIIPRQTIYSLSIEGKRNIKKSDFGVRLVNGNIKSR